MDAKPILVQIARALREEGLEAVLIGNAAASIQGAPVTTVDADFLFRKTPMNVAKLKRIAKSLGATIFTPFYPVSGLFRLIREDDGLQIDFMASIHGIRSFNTLRSRADQVDFDSEKLWVASLADIINSKRAADRPRDRAVLDVLEATLKAKNQADPDAGSGSA